MPGYTKKWRFMQDDKISLDRDSSRYAVMRNRYRPRTGDDHCTCTLFFFNFFLVSTLQVQLQISLVCATLQGGRIVTALK